MQKLQNVGATPGPDYLAYKAPQLRDSGRRTIPRESASELSYEDHLGALDASGMHLAQRGVSSRGIKSRRVCSLYCVSLILV